MIKKITVCTLLLGLNIPGQLCGARPERNDNQSWVQRHPYATATLAAITSAALGFWVAGKFYSLKRPPIKQTPPPLPPQFIPTMSLEQQEILTLKHNFALYERDVNVLKEQQRSSSQMSYGFLGALASLTVSTASFAWKYPAAIRDLFFGWMLVRIDTAVNAIRTDDLPRVERNILERVAVVQRGVTRLTATVDTINATTTAAHTILTKVQREQLRQALQLKQTDNAIKLNAIITCLPETIRLQLLPQLNQAMNNDRPFNEIRELQELINPSPMLEISFAGLESIRLTPEATSATSNPIIDCISKINDTVPRYNPASSMIYLGAPNVSEETIHKWLAQSSRPLGLPGSTGTLSLTRGRGLHSSANSLGLSHIPGQPGPADPRP